MGQGEHQLLLPQRPQPRPRLRSGGGEIVEVQGGHIVRSTGRKDRHSKVCTAKGPRDRRVRLSAHTAIQFYDVQDRLGYDRPSKAVDWLIKHAKAAIDELDELPPWHPSTASSTSTSTAPTQEPLLPPGDSGKKPLEPDNAFSFDGGSSSCGASLSFLPHSLDSDAIADTIKSFFPMAAATAGTANESSSSYHNYALPAQDLRLSLQSFQDHHVLRHQQAHTAPAPHPIFSFDPGSSSWWNMPAETSGGGGAYGFGGVPPQAMAMHPMVLGQSQLVTQRGPLQSSNSPSLRAWMDPVNAAAAASGVLPMLHPSSLPSVSAMGSGGGSGVGFSGFRMPARFQGEEEHDGISDKPSSAPTSHH